jgi:hypothetical protein
VVHRYGGDVIKFAGDAMIIAFYPDSDEMATDDQGYHRTVLRCAHCALVVRLFQLSLVWNTSDFHTLVSCIMLPHTTGSHDCLPSANDLFQHEYS